MKKKLIDLVFMGAFTAGIAGMFSIGTVMLLTESSEWDEFCENNKSSEFCPQHDE